MEYSRKITDPVCGKFVITIDGPAGAGKTTVSKELSKRLDYKYVDTGALYRGIALAADLQNVAPEDDAGLERLCNSIELKFVSTDNGQRLLLNHSDITDKIRTPKISMLASAVSARAVVRTHLLDLQRKMGREKGAVFEGRDMGTVVFPDAEIKFFLDASQDKRALRRYEEIKTKTSQSYKDVKQDMQKRDKNDSTRELAPLKSAEDAVVIDSTDFTVDKVVELMLSHIENIKKTNK